MKLLLLLLLLRRRRLVAKASCNLTAYHEWYGSEYTRFADLTNERLSVDLEAGFWGLTQSAVYFDTTPSFGTVMDKATQLCRESLKRLKVDIAGRHGEVHAYEIHRSMCRSYCVDADVLHVEAMRQSGCTCLELSSDDTTGDFCLQNSGRLLCQELDGCGVWDCRLSDFMCPRHEYNKGHTRFLGLGDCSAAATTTVGGAPLLLVAAATTWAALRVNH